jgi:hypothetical protein
MARGQRDLAQGERQLQARGGEPYRGSLLTRNETYASNRVYEHISLNLSI